MGAICMDLYLKHKRFRYQRGNRALKKQLLDEFCQTYGYHRKAAIRLLNGLAIPDKSPGHRGKQKVYKPEVLLEPLKKIWLATDQLCGKRLKEALPLWLLHYEKHHDVLEPEVLSQLHSMSAATIDRLLKPLRSRYHKGLSGTKPGSLLKSQIPVKTDQWDITQVGFMEADTVAHCGTSLKGDFVWSVTLTDIASGWTESRAVWNKGSLGVLTQIKSIEASLPFNILGFDCDNGSEFLNYHLMRYLSDRPQERMVQFTRSRPYNKNDNAHVEQKNWTHVRQLFGYHRFDNPALVALMNDLYAHEISSLFNFFYPSTKLIDKVRIKSSIKKHHDKPHTPYQRLLRAADLSLKQKQALTQQFNQLDPFQLQAIIQKKLKRLFKLVSLTKQRRAI